MRVAIFYPYNVLASWYTLGGYKNCLERMGHEVLDVPLPGNCYDKKTRSVVEVKSYPTIEQLNACDVIVLAFLEHINGWIDLLYGEEHWSRLTVPVIGRFDESFDRRDLGLPWRWENLKKWATKFSFPAAQDAEQFNGQWLVYGADIFMFAPTGLKKRFDVGFVGTLYDKRAQYARILVNEMPDIPIHHGPVLIQDLTGYRTVEQTELLAENYESLKIFFCFPPMSNLLVAKVFEVMSCGTFMMFPRLQGEAAKNLSIFEDGKHLVYYDIGNFARNAQQIRYWLEHEDERNRIARNGQELVQNQYSLEKMFDNLLGLINPRTPLDNEGEKYDTSSFAGAQH